MVKEKERNIYWVASICLISTKKEILFINKKTIDKKYRYMELPGGIIKENESPEEALSEGLIRDLGILLTEETLVPWMFSTKDYLGKKIVNLIYLSQFTTTKKVAQPDNEFIWKKIDELRNIDSILVKKEILNSIYITINKL